MKKITSYLSLWHTLFLSSVIIIIYLVTVQLTEALSFSPAEVVYFNQPNAEITWEPSRGPVSHYLLRITDTQFLSMKNARSTIKTVKEIKCTKNLFNLSCVNSHSYQVSVKAVSFMGFSSGFSPPSVLFIADQRKPEIFPDPLPSPQDLSSPDIIITGRYREPNLDCIKINGSSVSHNPQQQIFSGQAKLEPGMNTISIVACDLAGNSSRKDLEVVYVPEDATLVTKKKNLHPFATDCNGDDAIDLLLGTDDGKIALFINQGDNENPLFYDYSFLTSGTDGEIIDIGEGAVPFMADVNRDGLNDLLVGNEEGYLYYSENHGSSEEPRFTTIKLLKDTWNQTIRVDGKCNPLVVDWDGDGLNDILLGSGNGSIVIVKNQGENNDLQLTPPIPLKVDRLSLKVDGNSKPFVADWDNDGGKDLLIGDETGHLHIYLNSVVNGDPDLIRGGKIKSAEHTYVLEKELQIPYFIGISLLELLV
jgi:hypothetical protein